MNRIQQQLLPGILQKAAIIAGLIILINPCFAQDTYPFADTAIHAEQRIDNLLSLMTLDEKVTCLSTNPSIPRLGVKGTSHVEGLHGLARGGPSNWGRRDPVTTTIFPQAIGLAESWDPIVLKKVASVEAYEVRYLFQSPKYGKGGLVVRAPNADMGRDIRWGRNEECYGEDAFLTGVLTTAFIKGLQGDHPKYWLTASLMKHFLANSNENGRDSSSSNFDDRLYREYYSYPFMKGVTEGGSRAYMAAYNAYNEIPCTVHPMLKEITVKEWGQNGIICTDGGALRLLVTAHKEYPDLELAAAACIKAGIGQFLDRYTDGVKGALEKGYITETDIDSVLRGNFRVMLRLGLLDPPEKVLYSKIGLADTIDPWLKEEHKSIVRDVTRKTIVLLKNSDKTLPVERKRIRSIAVIGPLADTVLLDWYSGTPPYVISPFEGIKSNAGDAINVSCYSGNDNDSAVNLAKNSDLVVICAGNHPVCHYADWGKCTVPSDGREAVDRKSITLEQEVMIQKIYAANPNSILVLISSFPYAVNWSQENLPAILHMTHCSQEMGNALADVLFGNYNPAGRLVQTWPVSIDHLPDMMDYNIRNGRTYMYCKEKPLYPFGYGLSYTSFEYSNLRLSAPMLKENDEITVQVDVTNTGEVAGDEVVQLYLNYPASEVNRPQIALKGFHRVNLQPSETKTVTIPLTSELLSYWDTSSQRFKLEQGSVNILIGASSADIRLSAILKTVR